MNIVIIGATSGIGKALYEHYVSKGDRVGIVGRRTHLLEELRKKFPDNTITVTADITKQDEAEKAINMLRSELQHIDIAIVSSGMGNLNTELDYTLERPVLDTNVTGWTLVVDTLYHLFEQQGYGHLAAISSIGGLHGAPIAPSYCATKAYQINYLESLRMKAFKAGNRIHITDIRPGFVDTAMVKDVGFFWVMPVEKVARQIVTAIRKRKSKVYVTKRWHVLAILYKNLPFFWLKRL